VSPTLNGRKGPMSIKQKRVMMNSISKKNIKSTNLSPSEREVEDEDHVVRRVGSA
jgi:hypothetical protein